MGTAMATQQPLRDLAALGGGQAKVVTFYLDLEPSEFGLPGARTSQIESLVDAADRQTPGLDLHRPLDKEDPVVQMVQRLRDYLEGEFDPAGARSAAVFAASDRPGQEVLRLEIQVDPLAAVGDRPVMRPLLREPPPLLDCCVFLVSRRRAQSLIDRGLGLEQVEGLEDDVPGRHDQGGPAQARYQRHIEQHVRDHVKHACAQLRELHDRTGFDRLIIGGEEDVVPFVDQSLTSELSRLVIGRLGKDHVGAELGTIAAAATRIARADQERRDRELIDRLGERLGRNELGAVGVGDVLLALNERAVDTLLVSSDLQADGARCPGCGWLAEWEGECPVDGTRLRVEPDLVEAMIGSGFAQSATVRVMDDPLVVGNGGAAAILRFPAAVPERG